MALERRDKGRIAGALRRLQRLKEREEAA